MRKLTLLFIFGLAVSLIYAQDCNYNWQDKTKIFNDLEKVTYSLTNNVKNINSVFEEDFSGSWPPNGWTVSGLGLTNWSSSATNNASGTAPEAIMSWSPQFNGVSRFISPQINTTGYSTLALQFKHFVDNYAGAAYTVKLETSTNGSNWDELYSVSPTGNVGPLTVTSLVTNGIGTATFQIALTFSGNSYNVDYWYIDDVKLFEALSYDASADVISIPAQIPTNFTLKPSGKVTNNGIEVASFAASLEFKQGTTVIYTSTVNVIDLAAFQTQVVDFSDWPVILGDYTAYLTVALTGDQNPANDLITKDFQVLDGMVFKNQLLEEFTSSTSGPDAAANPIIDAVLAANQGDYSLIKYQMNWPGSGDIYYTEQGGDRRDYYGVSYVPDLYINSDQYNASSMSQALFDQYVDDITAMDIEAEATIDETGIISVSATLQPYANYPAGLKAHIVVVEKTTVGNVGSNGETEFHNVMMIMLPGSSGTTLGAIAQETPVQLSETYDMTTTNMEEPTDLAVIVFVQDDTDKSIIQSQMVDVQEGGFSTYSVTFNVHASNGEPVEGAEVNLESQIVKLTNEAGQVIYQEVQPGDYVWSVLKDGYKPSSGNFVVINDNVQVYVNLLPDYYFLPIWSSPYNPMTFYILKAAIDEIDLGSGAEVGIFDIDPNSGEEICVGAGVIVEPLTGGNYLEIIASMDDGSLVGQTNGFTPGHEIIYKLWSETTGETSTVQPNYPYPGYDEVFASQGSAFAELNGFTTITQEISLQTGWNLMSFRVEPENWNMLNIVQPVIDLGILYKVLDEAGGSIFHLPFPPPNGQWSNSIGNMVNTEGYYVKVTGDGSLSLEGYPVETPMDIPLTNGWNIISYPCESPQNALSAVQPLIDAGVLFKVIDEEGGTIFHLPFPPPNGQWSNTIGNFEGGEGYYVKVTGNATLNISCPVDGSDTLPELPEKQQTQFFQPVWENNPYLPMHLILYADEQLQAGDEIGIFDGEVCVGAAVVGQGNSEPVFFTTSMDDPASEITDGFITGNSFKIKVWSHLMGGITETGYQYLEGTETFEALGTFVGRLINLQTEISENPALMSDAEIQPNPFNSATNLIINLSSQSVVKIKVLNTNGITVHDFETKTLEKGKHIIKIDLEGMNKGVYVMVVEIHHDQNSICFLKKLVKL